MSPISLVDLKNAKLPTAGIYVLYENGTPQYVGRTGRLKARLKEHSYEKSSHFSASFAFLLAKENAISKGVDCKRNRSALEKDHSFGFSEAKAKVRLMQFRCVEITDPIAQTLFKVYAALELKTPYNSFELH